MFPFGTSNFQPKKINNPRFPISIPFVLLNSYFLLLVLFPLDTFMDILCGFPLDGAWSMVGVMHTDIALGGRAEARHQKTGASGVRAGRGHATTPAGSG